MRTRARSFHAAAPLLLVPLITPLPSAPQVTPGGGSGAGSPTRSDKGQPRAGEQAAALPRSASWQAIEVDGLAVEKQTLTFKQVDDVPLFADVYRPAGSSTGPTIVWLHGGALMWGSRTSLPRWQLALYLRRGYRIVAIDYRLAPETPLDAIVSDVEEAFHWLRSDGPRLGLDPRRVASVGYSAGGYLALLTGHRVSPRPQAIVSLYGYGDIVGDWQTKQDAFYGRQPAVAPETARAAVGKAKTLTEASRGDRWPFYLYCRQNGLWPREASGRDPVGDQAWFVQFCPARNVDRRFPPTLLVHGDNDTDVPFAQSVQLDELLAKHEVPHQLLRMAGYGHAFDRTEDSVRDSRVRAAYDDVLGFLRSHLH